METNKLRYVYTQEEVFNMWTNNCESKLDETLFLEKLEVLLLSFWYIENEFDDEQRLTQKQIFSKYDMNNDGEIDFQEFQIYYHEMLRSYLTIHYVIGIDVGGTNTDAVILEMPQIKVISSVKVPTTRDIKTGVHNSIVQVFAKQSIISRENIQAIFLGSTAFVNAVIQRSEELSPVTVIRLCGPSVQSFPPFVSFPEDLKKKLQEDIFFLNGGYHYTGKDPLSELSEEEIQKAATEIVEKYQKSNKKFVNVVISAVFSPINNSHEQKAKEILTSIFTEKQINFTITLGSEIGELGFIERENAAILNASLKQYAYKTINSFKKTFHSLGFYDNFFITQNDGTVAKSEYIAEFPVMTFSSGPVNSLRGASFLCKLKNCIVADIGGTTCDLAAMINGFARESTTFIEVGGVRTNFAMPNVQSIGLGGGSLVYMKENKVKVGPLSVGYRLLKEGIAFGGTTLTLTDIALKCGYCQIENGDPNLVNLDSEKIEKIKEEMIRLFQANVDQMKTNSEEIPLILVGGGGVIIPPNTKLDGISEIIRPQHFEVANAIGAAISKVSEKIDRIYTDMKGSKEKFEKEMIAFAIEAAAKKGAMRELTSVKEMIKTDLAYMPGNSFRMTLKVIGSMDLSKIQNFTIISTYEEELKTDEDETIPLIIDEPEHINYAFKFLPPNVIYNPETQRNEWILNEEDVTFISLGASILGSGGGGTPYHYALGAKQALHEGKVMRVISPKDVKQNEVAFPVGFFGAPLCMIEKLFNRKEIPNACEIMSSITQPVTCTMPIEIGGANSLSPLIFGAEADIPVVDVDLMGRAFPRTDLMITAILGLHHPPISFGDDHNNQILLNRTYQNDMLIAEKFGRSICENMSLVSGLCVYPLDGNTIRKYGICNTLSKTWRLGRAIYESRLKHLNLLEMLQKTENAKELIYGKITRLERHITGGYNMGEFDVEGFGVYKGKTLLVKFQNENLIAYLNGEVAAVTPDIITVLDINTFDAVLCESLRYGIRVCVVALPGAEILRDEFVLKKSGPQSFGYKDVRYVPFADYIFQESVVDEYGKKEINH